MNAPIVNVVKKLDILNIFRNEYITLVLHKDNDREDGKVPENEQIVVQLRIKKDGDIEIFCDKEKKLNVKNYSKWYDPEMIKE